MVLLEGVLTKVTRIESEAESKTYGHKTLPKILHLLGKDNIYSDNTTDSQLYILSWIFFLVRKVQYESRSSMGSTDLGKVFLIK